MQLLPPSYVEAYELDQLLVADFEGQLLWIIRQGSSWWFGDVLGPIIADAVVTSWNTLWNTGEVPDSWWV